ncbi:hypothetical protein [Rhizobium sp. SEMIA 4085]|uniref:hypothetical protein n=1 Tax=Rhizobium sp. SEMIA 4085 TaxID=2137761 RepID=UPI0006942246|nr:hypothetical protein [Rhizobium sp. SEMIA 4085]
MAELSPTGHHAQTERRLFLLAACCHVMKRERPIWARLMSDGKISSRSRSAFDMMIAAIAEANQCLAITSKIATH